MADIIDRERLSPAKGLDGHGAEVSARKRRVIGGTKSPAMRGVFHLCTNASIRGVPTLISLAEYRSFSSGTLGTRVRGGRRHLRATVSGRPHTTGLWGRLHRCLEADVGLPRNRCPGAHCERCRGMSAKKRGPAEVYKVTLQHERRLRTAASGISSAPVGRIIV